MLVRAPVSDVCAVILAALLIARVCGRSFATDSCDWVGSGLHQEERLRGVQPVYLRCAQGHIQWHYPRGALRVVLRHGTSGKDFRGCIRAAAGSAGARIYLEGHRKLFPLYTPGDSSSPDLHRCFTSTNGQAALYVEATPTNNPLHKDTTEFSYDLQSTANISSLDGLDDCRPCTEEETLHLFCTSDFVVQGTVSALYHNPAVQRSELTVRASRIIRDSHPPVWGTNKYATLHRPLRCGTKVGSGEFLFMGRWMLGSPMVRCVPRLVEWKQIKRKALQEGSNQCELD